MLKTKIYKDKESQKCPPKMKIWVFCAGKRFVFKRRPPFTTTTTKTTTIMTTTTRKRWNQKTNKSSSFPFPSGIRLMINIGILEKS